MTTKEFRLEGGLTYSLDVPATVQEYDEQAGEGACLRDAIASRVNSKVGTQVRELLAAAVEHMTGVARKTKRHPKGKKGADGKVLTTPAESPAEYVRRAAAENDRAVTSFQDLLNEVAEKVTFSFAPAVRVRKGPKPGKSDIALAQAFAGKPKEEQLSKLATVCTVLGVCLPEWPFSLDTLSRIFRDYRRHLEGQRKSLLQ